MSDTVTRASDRSLSEALDRARTALRSPEIVMQPAMLGAVRPTRYSFNRMFLRRASADGWRVTRTRFEMDHEGAGEAAYRLDLGAVGDHAARSCTFVAFTRVLDEAEHTDRVIANRWEVTGCLVDGDVDGELLTMLRTEIPRQERARLDPRVLVLTRGNRSVRFFEYLVDCLASGRQPDPGRVGDSGYIMRSTAFYANGKYGMRSFEGYEPDHPLAVPYRAQFACAWLFRELGYDVVEHCAAARGRSSAVPFDPAWATFFGLGNATGLGLVPYAFTHPRVVNAWVAVREVALAEVRALPAAADRRRRLTSWVERARLHLTTGTDDDCAPFLSPQSLRPRLDDIAAAWAATEGRDLPFDELYRWAEATGEPETIEWVVALLLELSELGDEAVDRWFAVDEQSRGIDPGLTMVEIAASIDSHWGWLDELDLADAEADAFWWVISDNTEEPRRVRRSRLDPDGRDVAIDIALRVARLRRAITPDLADVTVDEFLTRHPEHRLAVTRLATDDDPYGEPRDNACAEGYLPLQLQRFQLAQYGMDHFKPKSTDWLRVTLNQGAPRAADLNAGTVTDDWALPIRPGAT